MIKLIFLVQSLFISLYKRSLFRTFNKEYIFGNLLTLNKILVNFLFSYYEFKNFLKGK